MGRKTAVCAAVLAAAVAASSLNAAVFTFSENWEGNPVLGGDPTLPGQWGAGAWVDAPPGGVLNDTPQFYSATDVLLGHDVGANLNNPGSQSAGFNRAGGGYDGTQAAWLYKQFPNAVAPGTYDVTLTADIYCWARPGDLVHQPWGIANRTMLLTDALYDRPSSFNTDNMPVDPGFRRTRWNQDFPSYSGQYGGGTWMQLVVETTLTTATGNIRLELLNHDKFNGWQAVAWDNISLRIVPEPASLLLLSLGLPLLRRRVR